MTDTEKLALALAAIEAAKELIPDHMRQVSEIDGSLFCDSCISEWRSNGFNPREHSEDCGVLKFMELVTKLEQST